MALYKTNIRSNLLEELTLRCARITNDANIDVATETRALHGDLGHATKQHEQNPPLYFIVACSQHSKISQITDVSQLKGSYIISQITDISQLKGSYIISQITDISQLKGSYIISQITDISQLKGSYISPNPYKNYADNDNFYSCSACKCGVICFE